MNKEEELKKFLEINGREVRVCEKRIQRNEVEIEKLDKQIWRML